MDYSLFTNPAAGSLVNTTYGQKAFLPTALPPNLDLSGVHHTLSEADQKMGELRGIGAYLPNPYLLIRPLQRSEAIASSNIEGTFTSLPELLLLEAGVEDQQRTTDTMEVFNYVRALQHGVDRLNDLPLSNRLILELHERLLRYLPQARRGQFPSGEFRSDQNFIGRQRDIAKARFIPPPPPLHLQCMNELELFMNRDNNGGFPALVFLALVHYQFETIHPFPDGNGRIGRLLIPLILKAKGVMNQPLLYMSQYFENNKDEYVDLMLRVSQSGDWTNWIEFFLKGVIESCKNIISTIEKVQQLQRDYMDRCRQARSSALLTRIIEDLFERPLITVPGASKLTGTSYRAAKNNLEKLVHCGILFEGKMNRRPKYYVATELVRVFEQ
jgi:Fic family protein